MAEYELVLMLDPALDEGKREALADETRKLIESGGELKHADNWGLRKMAYEIEQRTEADYRFYRFAADNALLGQLDHNLKIADGTLRFRVFRVEPGASVNAPPPVSTPHTSAPRDSERRVAPTEPAPAAPAEPTAAPPAAAEAEPTEAEPAEAEPTEDAPAETEPTEAPPGGEPAAPESTEDSPPAEAEPAEAS